MNKLRISGIHYQELIQHLFPGDYKEAVALALCGRSGNNQDHILTVHEVITVPYEMCYERKEDLVRWPTEIINPLLQKATKYGYAILKIHCHPGGGEFFSEYDNESDINLFTSVQSWLDDNLPHASCIMLPDKRIFGRIFDQNIQPEVIHQISIAGSNITNWYYDKAKTFEETLQVRNLQAFGRQTVAILNRLRIGVVGCSGTGSPTIEQLKRLGVGELILVDPDHIDVVNLNRIIGSSLEDARQGLSKVSVMAREVQKVGFGTSTKIFNSHISEYAVVKELSTCDILFSCVDGAEGRHILNLISSYYIIPLIDMGVKLDADGKGGINGIYGTVHFIQPGGSSLLNRGQYSLEKLRAEGIKRTNKEEFERNQYLANVNESSPAVISVNMQIAATAVNEFLARIHPYRTIDNTEIDAVKIMYGECISYSESFPNPCPFFSKFMGRGDINPLLNNPELSAL
ncbi:MAG: hypothetical protein BGO55_14150 [Sphingobacteriales bacterium 50-39]|nr:ThiF family adenylyltransferase [Sphingobacteriales bacterium]OJW57433.1 MAG: hypothetical protein BGO55_14150 [Sphingobacteriales bacterium 50-39]